MLHVALAIDTSHPARSRADQKALVRAVFEAPPEEQETNWLEWKGPLNLVAKEAIARATIAKAVLGFSNRDPSVASRAMGGCGYLLVGVSPGELAGVQAVDAAQLEAQVATYVGGVIAWRADYVVVEEQSVLVVTVEPPAWGDPLHPVRKTFNPSERRAPVLQAGTVFVRHQASTDPATPTDMDMLSRRAARRPGDQLDVDVRLTAGSKLRAIDVCDRMVGQYVARERSRLLAPFSTVSETFRASSPVFNRSVMGVGYPSEKRFREEVQAYLHDLEQDLAKALRARAVMHDMARLRLEVVNETDKTYTGVRIEMLLPSDVKVWNWRGDAPHEAELPVPPEPYGTASFGGFPTRSPLRLKPIIPFKVALPQVERRPDAVHVAFAEADVRAQGVEPLRSVWLVIDDPALDTLPFRWEATATNAEKRLSGSFGVLLTRPAAGVDDLMSDLPAEGN
jgi:hypothetical protein